MKVIAAHNGAGMTLRIILNITADFDGDEVNITLLLDDYLKHRGDYLRPHYGILSLSDLGAFNNNVCLPEVTVSVISNFVNEMV